MNTQKTTQEMITILRKLRNKKKSNFVNTDDMTYTISHEE
jgi:hypothetical protein